jgi:hypothetical protein
MRLVMSTLIIGCVLLLSGDVGSGQARGQLRGKSVPGKFASSGSIARGGPMHRYTYAYPYTYYQPYYQPYYPPVVVISPYAPPYHLLPTVVATSPYFCLFHNEEYVSRVGMLDHLVGAAHRIPLETAAALCPEGSCIFPSY